MDSHNKISNKYQYGGEMEMEKTIQYSFDKIIKEDIPVFCDMLSYVSPYINSTIRKEDMVDILVDEGHEAEVIEKVDYLVEIMKMDEVRKKRDVSIKTIKNFMNVPINMKPIFDELINSRTVIPTCDGAYAYSGVFLDVFNYFCRKIDSFGKQTFGDIKQYELPDLYPIDKYEQGGYFESFPHYMMFQATLCNDITMIEEYSKLASKSGEILKYIQTPQNVLRHAACVPVYPLYENAVIDDDQPINILVSGKCFRNEGNNVFELARLKEFYMKEYVFIGTEKQTHEGIKKARQLWDYWIDTFKLNGEIDTANDSFFASNYKKLKIFQIIGDSKQEFRLLLPSSNTLCASSSANIHRTHFTKRYNIRNKEGYCSTSCFAFGVERLTYSLLSQKGIEPEKWDKATRNEIYGK